MELLVEATVLADAENNPEQITDKKARKAYHDEAVKHMKLLKHFVGAQVTLVTPLNQKACVKQEVPDLKSKAADSHAAAVTTPTTEGSGSPAADAAGNLNRFTAKKLSRGGMHFPLDIFWGLGVGGFLLWFQKNISKILNNF